MNNEEKFDTLMKKLQEIVSQLEKEDIDLDEAIGLYEQGLKLSKTLKQQLEDLEKKVNELNDEK